MTTVNKMWAIFFLVAFLTQNAVSSPKKKVCVLGSGVSGINSIKQVADHLDEFEPVGFDKNSGAGGLWIYNEDGHVDKHGLPVHSSAYANLKTNTPKELMAFPDYREFHGPEHSTVRHIDVQSYLQNYTRHFNLDRFIKFDTLVEKVSLVDQNQTKWIVKTRDLNTNVISETICDAVIVCTGHYSTPNIPKITGIQNFKGHVSHSHSYRHPEVYAGKTVVILGASASGVDIAIDISPFAKKVYLSHKHKKIQSSFPSNVEQVLGVVSAELNHVILSDGTKLFADAFVYATGYIFDYPFLDSSSHLTIQKTRVYPLYKKLINAYHTSMAIVGVPSVISPFLVPYFQAKYYVAVLRGIVTLPSRKKMIKDADTLPPGAPKNKYHNLDDNQWNYIKELAQAGKFEPLPDYYEKAYNTWNKHRLTHLETFRKVDLQLNNDGNFRLILPQSQ